MRKLRLAQICFFVGALVLLVCLGDVDATSLPEFARASALGDMILTDGIGVVSALAFNPAALVDSTPGIVYTYNNKFGITDYSSNNFGISTKKQNKAMALLFCAEEATLKQLQHSNLKNNFMGEYQLGIGIGFKVREPLSIGVSIWNNYQKVNLCEDPEEMSGMTSDLTIDLGLLSHKNNIGCAFVARDFNSRGGLPSYNIGIRYGQVGSSSVMINMSHELNCLNKYETIFTGGIEFYLSSGFILRVGYDKNGKNSFGAGFINGKLQIDYARKVHQTGTYNIISSAYSF